MATRPTAAEREEKTVRAVELSSKGWTNTDIAEEIGVTRKTVANWIENELSRRAEHRENDKERSIAVYTELVAEGWRRLEKLDDRSLNVSGVLNAIRAAQERIDKITGAEAPLKHQKVDQEIVIEWEDLDAALTSDATEEE
jgi:orotate phosphoribosyltransferase-like protein